MKWPYKLALWVNGMFAAVFTAGIVWDTLSLPLRFELLIQGLAVLVALGASIVALGAQDRKRPSIRMKIEPSVLDSALHRKIDLYKDIRPAFESYPDPIPTHRISFKVTNCSGFTLKSPALTFWLPKSKQHPKQGDDLLYRSISFNSNLFNDQREIRLLEFGDQIILSNRNVPYLNDGDELAIWIRMAIADNALSEFDVKVSVNAENAEGVTKILKIKPGELLSSMNHDA